MQNDSAFVIYAIPILTKVKVEQGRRIRCLNRSHDAGIKCAENFIENIRTAAIMFPITTLW